VKKQCENNQRSRDRVFGGKNKIYPKKIKKIKIEFGVFDKFN